MDALLDELRRFSLTYSGFASMVGLTDNLTEIGSGVVQAEFSSRENLLQAIQRVQSSGGSIHDMTAQEGSLENYFIDTISRAA